MNFVSSFMFLFHLYLNTQWFSRIQVNKLFCQAQAFDARFFNFINLQCFLNIQYYNLPFTMWCRSRLLTTLTAGLCLTRFCLSSSSCELYLAKSTIPNAGLGIFTTVPRKRNDSIGNGDVCIPILDLEWYGYDPQTQFVNPFEQPMTQTLPTQQLDPECYSDYPVGCWSQRPYPDPPDRGHAVDGPQTAMPAGR